MSYLISQIIICLLIAFLFGVLIGWLLKSIICKRKLRELESKPLTKAFVDTPKAHNSMDDLKEIFGVGPVFEKMLHKNGINSFKQVAELNSNDINDLSDQLNSFKDRIVRDAWASSAKELHFNEYGERL
ncbi:MAG: hypothetical protein MUP82_02440 [Candidatus Marinimicrobia bacterium]|nr:hypothetical protein [Candidatus Neomarinimicrobiota bacterium]